MARAPMPAPQPLETPAMKRSALLARLLEEGRRAPQQIAGYGDLGARLLAQGLLQWQAGKADKAVKEEQRARIKSQADSVAARLAALTATPGAGPAMPSAPPVTNTQEPQQAQVAPAAQVVGSPMPDIGQPNPIANVPQPQAPQQPAQPPRNPLSATPQEAALINRALSSGDPSQIAWAQEMLGGIEMRMADPAAGRQKVEMINGVPYYVDPAGVGAPTPVFQGGLPQEVMTQDVMNVPGTTPGTLAQRGPTGKLDIVQTPSSGFMRPEGSFREVAIPGGPQDQGAGGNQIANERQLRGEFQRETASYRDAKQGLDKVNAAIADGSGASDIALIFGYMKTLDPTSTVREGEAAMVQQTGSIPEQVVAMYNRAIAGERLTPQMRSEIGRAAAGQFATYEDGYNSRLTEYQGMADRYGLDWRNIIGEAQPAGRAAPRRQPAPQRRPAAPAPANDDPLGLR